MILVCLACQSCDAFEQTLPPAWQVELCTQLADLKAGRFFELVVDEPVMTETLALDAETAIPAVLEMFVRHNHSHEVEIFWWAHETRSTRCFTLALYLCATNEGPSWMPEFERNIKRFNEKEQQERQEELQFILDHRSALAVIIAQILQKRSPEIYHSEFEGYFGIMAKVGLGKRLPNWCTNAKK